MRLQSHIHPRLHWGSLQCSPRLPHWWVRGSQPLAKNSTQALDLWTWLSTLRASKYWPSTPIFGNASVSPWLTAFTSDEGEKSGQKDENERKKKRKKCVRRGGKEEREKRSRRHKKKSVPHLWEDGCTPAATWNALQRQIVWKVMWNYYADIIMTIQHVAKSVS